MSIPIWQVDAFTRTPGRGNPAAVCFLREPAPEAWMALVAREMNLSETAFLVPRHGEHGELAFELRWFTPAAEVELCGHATLASAHVLWETGELTAERPVRFHTQSGVLTVKRADGGWIEMDFPAEPAEPAPDSKAEVAAVLGVEEGAIRHLAANRLDLLVELGDADHVAELTPDLARMESLPRRGVIVTARADEEEVEPDDGSDGGVEPADFVSRYFAPAVGVAEDPVTGSAHCALGPHWAGALGKETLVGHQLSARGGVVRVRLGEGVGEGRVILCGEAVTVLAGQLAFEP